jgi:hypothetical protein
VRYKDLTGLALLNALNRNINRIAFENKWDFIITLGNISDRMLFRNFDDLLLACKVLLGVTCEHIGVVLGKKLARNVLNEAISSLDQPSIVLIEKYSIDAYLGAPRTNAAMKESIDV